MSCAVILESCELPQKAMTNEKRLVEQTHQFLFLQSKATTPLESGVHLIPDQKTRSQFRVTPVISTGKTYVDTGI